MIGLTCAAPRSSRAAAAQSGLSGMPRVMAFTASRRAAGNRLPGRGHDFLESTGLLWFWNYKLRIMKVVARTLRDRPINSLFFMGGCCAGDRYPIRVGWISAWRGSRRPLGLLGRVGDGV